MSRYEKDELDTARQRIADLFEAADAEELPLPSRGATGTPVEAAVATLVAKARAKLDVVGDEDRVASRSRSATTPCGRSVDGGGAGKAVAPHVLRDAAANAIIWALLSIGTTNRSPRRIANSSSGICCR
jgi:hypothetical protein